MYKYWYIIMPLAIMGLFGGVEEEPAQDARRAPAVAATSAVAGGTAAAATGGQVRQRRGKRD